MSESPIEIAYPLTPLQEGMLFHTVREPDSDVYRIQYTATLRGELKEELLRKAWTIAAERHAVLRTLFTWEKRERPLQVVLRRVELPWGVEDWRDLDEDQLDRRWKEVLARDRQTPFAMNRAPVMRFSLVRTGDETWRVLWSLHHVLMDGWSGRLLLKQVYATYEALASGGEPDRTPGMGLDLYLAWLGSQDAEAAERYWSTALEGASVTPLASAVRVPAHAGPGHGRCSVFLDTAETAAVSDAAKRFRVTPHTLVSGAWALLLARYLGTQDVTLGVTQTVRPPELAGVDTAIGLYLNTVPFRTRLADGEGVGDWLERCQATQSEARGYDYASLPDIQRWAGGDALFDSIVVYERFAREVEEPRSAQAVLVEDEALEERSNFAFALIALPGERLELILVHDHAACSTGQAERIAGHAKALLVALAGADAAANPWDLPMTGAAENALLQQWSRAAQPLPKAEDVLTLADRHAADRPGQAAARHKGASTSYQELRSRSLAVAAELAERGVAPGATVGLMASRGPAFLVAALGCLRAGVAYAPLDPKQPSARLERLAGGMDALLVPAEIADAAPRVDGLLVIEEAAADTSSLAEPEFGPADAAYVIYTSGSTGEPKGVVIERRHLAASTAARFAYYGEHPGRFLLMSAPTVDSSVAGIYWTLAAGGTLVMPEDRAEQDIGKLAELIATERVTHTLLLPALYQALLENAEAAKLASLRCVVVAGESCPPDLVALHHQLLPGVELHNEYGPSEGTVWCTAGALLPGSDVSIGRPTPGAHVHIVDERMAPTPIGVVGELVIGGAYVARGYRGRPDLTSERFAPDPFTGDGRIYRTGDRARYLADGRIEFLGRADNQVKIRGFRVELGEVERALAAEDSVREAAAVVEAASPPGRSSLVAYATPHPGTDLDGETLRETLLARLPDYMVPRVVSVLDDLPRTRAGKIDRVALAAIPVEEPLTVAEFTPPRDAREETIAKVWCGVLQIDELSVFDNFFELGGDSLLSIRAISRLARAGLQVEPEAFFEKPTVAALALIATEVAPKQTAAKPRKKALDARNRSRVAELLKQADKE